MYANRYTSSPNTRRPNEENSVFDEALQPSSNERERRFNHPLDNHGISVRTERTKVDTDNIRWLG